MAGIPVSAGLSGPLPTGTTGRVLALGIALLLLAAAWLAVAQPLIAWHGDLLQAVENRSAVARRMEAVAGTLPQLRLQAEATGSNGAGPMVLLAGNTDALASATLQARLRELTAQAQVSLNSAETLPAEDTNGFRRIGLRISATCDWQVLVRLLEALDQSSPRMLVDDLQLQVAVAVAGAVTRPLNVTMTVFAFRAASP